MNGFEYDGIIAVAIAIIVTLIGVYYLFKTKK